MDFEDVAKGKGPDIFLTGELPHRPPAMLDGEVTTADDLTPEDQFPEFGKFCKVWPGIEEEREPEYWELTSALAEEIVKTADELDVDADQLWLRIDRVEKTASGEWRYMLAVSDEADDVR